MLICKIGQRGYNIMKFRVQPHRYYPQVSAQVRKEKLLVLFWEELMRREKKKKREKEGIKRKK